MDSPSRNNISTEFCLKWNNHHSTLVTVLDTLLKQESLVDVTLAAEGKFIKVHRVVLCACSSYFQELLCDQWDKQAIIFLKDVKFNQLQALVEYMYHGEVNVLQGHLKSFLNTAEALKIKGLAERDEDHFRRLYSKSNHQTLKPAAPSSVPEIPSPLKPMPEPNTPDPPSDLSDLFSSHKHAEKDSVANLVPDDITDETSTDDILCFLQPKIEALEPEDAATMEDEARWSGEEIEHHDDPGGTMTSTERLNRLDPARNTPSLDSSSRFTCSTCPRSYKNRADMRKHMRFECGKEPRFACTSCGSRFWRSYHLHRHLRQVHCLSV